MSTHAHDDERIDALRRDGRWKELLPLVDRLKKLPDVGTKMKSFGLVLVAEMILHKVPTQYGRSLSAASLDQVHKALLTDTGSEVRQSALKRIYAPRLDVRTRDYAVYWTRS